MSYPITFGKYLLMERINVGGMAEVFKAKAFGVEGFERILAIKRILPNMAEDEEFINMFIDEARIAVQLNHPNIVPIYELGKCENQYYIAMEYVPGKDLRQILDRFRKKKETLPIAAAAFVVSKICEGLDYAHHKTDSTGRPLQLIHRDVSPQNILVGYEGAIKITDFGIVKGEDRVSKTQAGVLKGKFGYMSPEQVRGLEIDNRSDIFAVGILLYEMVTGHRLFIGESDFSTLEKVRNADVTPPTQHNASIGPVLENIMLKALARERDERYQTASELHDDLEQFLIEDTSIFGAKRLAALLKAEYQEDIQADMQKMEEFMRLAPPPVPEAVSAVSRMGIRALGDNRNEETMIFESGFGGLVQGSVLMGRESSGTHAPISLSSLSEADLAAAGVSEVARSERFKPRSRAWKTWVLSAGAVLAVGSGLGWGVYKVLHRPSRMGTLVVTSTPVDTVDIFVDGERVAQKTPLVRSLIPVGEHTLLAKAPGFRDKAYRFDLVAGAPAEIRIELERQPPAETPPAALSPAAPPEVTVEINSHPTMASVRVGGLPQGTTPVTLHASDPGHAMVVEISKPGFVTQQVSVTWAPEDKKKAVYVTLPAVAVEKAVLSVRSHPDHATVSIDGTPRGTTPVDLTDLNTQQVYHVKVVKEGFRAFEEELDMKGQRTVQLDVRLVSERRTHASRSPASCLGTGGKISIMPVGVGDCRVTVGRVKLGVAPIFKKSSPVGHCVIEVTCPNNKHFQAIRTLRAGREEKIIIKPEDWSS